MKNSVAIYPWVPWGGAAPTPALGFFGRCFGDHVDDGLSGLCCAGFGRAGRGIGRAFVGYVIDFVGQCVIPDELTVKKFTVSATVKVYVFDFIMKSATTDELPEKHQKPYTRARGRARTRWCVCQFVISSVVYYYIYISISYLTDSTLTGTDSRSREWPGQHPSSHSLWGGQGRAREFWRA